MIKVRHFCCPNESDLIIDIIDIQSLVCWYFKGLERCLRLKLLTSVATNLRIQSSSTSFHISCNFVFIFSNRSNFFCFLLNVSHLFSKKIVSLGSKLCIWFRDPLTRSNIRTSYKIIFPSEYKLTDIDFDFVLLQIQYPTIKLNRLNLEKPIGPEPHRSPESRWPCCCSALVICRIYVINVFHEKDWSNITT